MAAMGSDILKIQVRTNRMKKGERHVNSPRAKGVEGFIFNCFQYRMFARPSLPVPSPKSTAVWYYYFFCYAKLAPSSLLLFLLFMTSHFKCCIGYSSDDNRMTLQYLTRFAVRPSSFVASPTRRLSSTLPFRQYLSTMSMLFGTRNMGIATKTATQIRFRTSATSLELSPSSIPSDNSTEYSAEHVVIGDVNNSGVNATIERQLETLQRINSQLQEENNRLKRDMKLMQQQQQYNSNNKSRPIILLESFEGGGASLFLNDEDHHHQHNQQQHSLASTHEYSKILQQQQQQQQWCDEVESSSGECPLEPGVLFQDAVRDRAYWLVGLLAAQSCSGFILARNEELLQNHPVIIFFLTMLIGAGGNAGNQASVRVIRGLALGSLNEKTQSQFIAREVKMAFALSLILSVAGFLRASLFQTPFPETIAVTGSLCVIVFSSICLGAALPLGLKRLGVDPVHSSTTIQVLMDILGVILTVIISGLILDTSMGKFILGVL